MDAKMETALVGHVKEEFYSSHLYLSMSSWADANGFKGAANWLRIQFQEEQAHALRFFDYLKDRGIKIAMPAIAQPPSQWTDLMDLFQEVKKHEQQVTKLINDLYTISVEGKDHAASAFLHWFVNEQVEEEKNAQDIIDQLRIIGGNGSGLYMLDKELATRIFIAPTFGITA